MARVDTSFDTSRRSDWKSAFSGFLWLLAAAWPMPFILNGSSLSPVKAQDCGHKPSPWKEPQNLYGRGGMPDALRAIRALRVSFTVQFAAIDNPALRDISIRCLSRPSPGTHPTRCRAQEEQALALRGISSRGPRLAPQRFPLERFADLDPIRDWIASLSSITMLAPFPSVRTTPPRYCPGDSHRWPPAGDVACGCASAE
jgi:hypothetical protein